MNWMELLRSLQAPAVDTETGYYNTYEPHVSQTITETDDEQPNKRVTKIDYMPTREVGSLSMGPQSMMAAERRGYDPTLMQSEEKIDMDRLYTDTIGNTGMTSNQIIQGAMADPMYPPTEYATPMAAGAILPRIFGRGRAAKAGAETSPILDASGKAVEKATQAADELAQSSGLMKSGLTA